MHLTCELLPKIVTKDSYLKLISSKCWSQKGKSLFLIHTCWCQSFNILWPWNINPFYLCFAFNQTSNDAWEYKLCYQMNHGNWQWKSEWLQIKKKKINYIIYNFTNYCYSILWQQMHKTYSNCHYLNFTLSLLANKIDWPLNLILKQNKWFIFASHMSSRIQEIKENNIVCIIVIIR